MIGGSWDSGQRIWDFWWTDKAVQQGNFLPYFTTMLYFPRGVSLAYHTLALFNGYQAVLFHRMIGMSFPAAYNTIAIIALLISAIGAYLLAFHLTHNKIAAFVAGIIFTFAPVHVSRLHFGHLGAFTSVQFLPWIILCIIKWGETRQWRYMIACAILTAAIGWQDLQIAFGTSLLIIILVLLFGHPRVDSRKFLLQCLVTALMILLLLFPVIYPMLRDSAEFKDQTNQTAASISNSPDLLDFISPDRSISLLWRVVLGRIGNQPLTDFYQIKGQKTVFIGVSVILLCIISLFTVSFKSTWRWWLIAITFLVISLGPVLQINRAQVFHHMPYALFSYLPMVGAGREPARFGIFVVLPLAFITAIFIEKISHGSFRNTLALLILCPLIYIELIAIPVKMDDRLVNVPEYYYTISKQSTTQPGAILDVPYDLLGAVGPACNYMVYQTIHQRPIVSGYISRAPKSAVNMLDGYPFIHQLRARIYGDTEPVHFSDKLIGKGLNELRALKIAFVILHKSELSSDDAELMKNALTQAVNPPLYEDNRIVVWRITE